MSEWMGVLPLLWRKLVFEFNIVHGSSSVSNPMTSAGDIFPVVLPVLTQNHEEQSSLLRTASKEDNP